MDDMSQKIQALLSDPESLRNLAELAAMLRQDDAESPAAAADLPDETENAAADGDAQDGDPLPFDPAKLLVLAQVLGQMQQTDENVKLLLALKPHLSPRRAKRTDQAIKMLRLCAAADALRENGLLNDLLGSFS